MAKRLATGLTLAFAFLLALSAGHFYRWTEQPLAGDVLIEFPSGSSLSTLARDLHSKGVLPSRLERAYFRLLGELDDVAGQLQELQVFSIDGY